MRSGKHFICSITFEIKMLSSVGSAGFPECPWTPPLMFIPSFSPGSRWITSSCEFQRTLLVHRERKSMAMGKCVHATGTMQHKCKASRQELKPCSNSHKKRSGHNHMKHRPARGFSTKTQPAQQRNIFAGTKHACSQSQQTMLYSACQPHRGHPMKNEIKLSPTLLPHLSFLHASFKRKVATVMH